MRYRKRLKRVVKRFAIFPIKICGEYRWLETVYIVQRYNEYSPLQKWYNREFTTKFEYEKDKQKWIINSKYCKGA